MAREALKALLFIRPVLYTSHYETIPRTIQNAIFLRQEFALLSQRTFGYASFGAHPFLEI